MPTKLIHRLNLPPVFYEHQAIANVDPHPELLHPNKNLKKPCILRLLHKGERKVVRTNPKLNIWTANIPWLYLMLWLKLKCTRSHPFMNNTIVECSDRHIPEMTSKAEVLTIFLCVITEVTSAKITFRTGGPAALLAYLYGPRRHLRKAMPVVKPYCPCGSHSWTVADLSKQWALSNTISCINYSLKNY